MQKGDRNEVEADIETISETSSGGRNTVWEATEVTLLQHSLGIRLMATSY